MTISLYPEYVLANDLSPDAFGSEVDEACQEIENATKGMGANRQRVIDVLATKDSTERAKISMRYMELFGRDHKKYKNMADLMEKEFSGDFGDALEFLALPAHQAECRMIRKACKGIGANVDVVWSIVAGRTTEEMELLKKTFYQMYDKDLGKLLASELHGNMERFVFACLQASEDKYDPQFHTLDKAREDADTIHKKGQGKFFGTDEKGIYKILTSSPPEHLQNVNRFYTEKFGFTLWKAMETEMSGIGEKNLKQATLYLIGMKQNPHETMAKLVDQACRGFGTDELLFMCTLIRFQPHMGNLYTAYIEMYGKTIHDLIRSEVGGKLKSLLLTILNAVWPEPV